MKRFEPKPFLLLMLPTLALVVLALKPKAVPEPTKQSTPNPQIVEISFHSGKFWISGRNRQSECYSRNDTDCYRWGWPEVSLCKDLATGKTFKPIGRSLVRLHISTHFMRADHYNIQQLKQQRGLLLFEVNVKFVKDKDLSLKPQPRVIRHFQLKISPKNLN